MTFKLNRADAIRPQAELTIDRYFGSLIDTELGPMAKLHALKRMQAIYTPGETALIETNADRDAILRNAAEQDDRIKELDSKRRAMKAAVRAATTSAEIAAILEQLNHAA